MPKRFLAINIKHLALFFLATFVVIAAGVVYSQRTVHMPDEKLYIIGDSTTALYNNSTGSSTRGWWSMLSSKINLTPVVNAQAGSGFISQGKNCKGTTFGQRLTPEAKQAIRSAKLVIIAGGRNDYHKCLGDDTIASASPQELKVAVDAFMNEIDILRSDDKTVYVATFWGTRVAQHKDSVTQTVRESALEHGFQWVKTDNSLTDKTTIDGTHPNIRGSINLSRAVYNDSDIAVRAQ